MNTSSSRYSFKDLQKFTIILFEKCGLAHDRAAIVANTLIESDLMGHTTHGLQLLPPYVSQLKNGNMTVEGEPKILHDHGATISWDGNYLPGPYLLHKAIDIAFSRIKEHPVITFTIQKSHHIGCLAAYPEIVTKKGLVMLLSCSDPKNATIAPFGGLTGVYSPNPIAAGFPTKGDPIIIDISMSETTNGLILRTQKEGKKLSQPFILTNNGTTSDDPKDFFTEPPGTILPLGGMTNGYKGFGMGLLVEALTSALGGYGRSNHPTRWGASVFMQIIDPGAFGGISHFKKEMDYLIEKSLQSAPIREDQKIRIPGHRALALKREQLEKGIILYPTIIDILSKLAEENSLEPPTPIN